MIQNVNAAMIKTEDCDYTLDYTLVTEVSENNRLLYYSTSSYTSTIDNAVAKWQNLGSVSIIKSYISNNYDVKISDYTQQDNVMGVTNFSNMTIKFNKYYFEEMTTSQKTKTILHEFGHALGLEHHSISGNVMKSGKLSLTSLGSQDKSSYSCYWN